jgi:AcrR family transcriptional regulator
LVEAAERIADERGFEAVTVHGLAAEFGVKAPSLYNHVSGLEEIRDALRVRGLRLLGERLSAALETGGGVDPLFALGDATRRFARDHRGLYAAAQPTVSTPETAEELAEAGEAILGLFTRVLGNSGIAGDDTLHATRAVRSAVHGFIELEAAGAFGMAIDIDESFRRLMAVLAAGLKAQG